MSTPLRMTPDPPDSILASWKINEVLRRYPDLLDTFVALSPVFRPLRNPVARRAQAQIVGLEPTELVRTLNVAVGIAPPVAAVTAGTEQPTATPPWLGQAPIAAELDARPLLDRGEEPFTDIMRAAAAVPIGQVLRLRAPFEPLPLYDAFAKRGFVGWARRLGPNDWEVSFLNEGRTHAREPAPSAAPDSSDALDWDAPSATVTIDVSDLVPPEPMVAILEALARLPPGGALRVHHRPPDDSSLPAARRAGLPPRDTRAWPGPGRAADPKTGCHPGGAGVSAAVTTDRPVAASSLGTAHAPTIDLPARFLALAVLVLAGLAVLAPWTMPLMLGSFYDPRLLAFVHVNTLGVVGCVVLGASYQFLPVVLQTPLASVRCARLSFWCYLGGLFGLPAGLATGWLPALLVGGTLLTLAFCLYAGVVATTLRRAPHRDIVAWHIAVAVAGLLGGVAYGLILVINKGTGFLGGSTLDNLAAHATLMVGGWIAVLLSGVAYRLVGMFILAENALWVAGAWLGLALTSAGAWMLSTNLHLSGPRTIDLVGAAALLGGLGLFLGQLIHLYRHRRRRGIDIHMPFVTAALLVVGFVGRLPLNDPLWVAAGWLAIAGLAETAIQGFFYKIAMFLVWLHTYAPLAGKQRVSRLEELYDRRFALTGWALWTLGVALAAVAVLLGDARGSRVGGVLITVGLGCFLVNVARISGHWWASSTGDRVPAPRAPRRRPS